MAKDKGRSKKVHEQTGSSKVQFSRYHIFVLNPPVYWWVDSPDRRISEFGKLKA
jgi:hypothetical protein